MNHITGRLHSAIIRTGVTLQPAYPERWMSGDLGTRTVVVKGVRKKFAMLFLGRET
jgi:hypothetical protein